MLDNLARNAITYSDAGGRITITAEPQVGAATISVTDTGIGIERQHLDRIFDPYRRIDRGRPMAGLGLGLTLVRGLVELHGGTITARSDGPGKGSTFTMTLPVASSTPSSPATPAASPPRRKVLVVDDERDVADTFMALLSGLGQDVHVAYRGAEALAEAQARPPDVVFVDLAMPGMDGEALARELRRVFADGIMLVALSGHASTDGALDGLFDRHLLKPAPVEAVGDVLRLAGRTGRPLPERSGRAGD
jgi:CheY-like chemotaxis protein/anti-sigma regulatory factor (Ser/Thr protein kinase)